MIHFAGTLGFGDLASLASNDSLFAATAVEKLEQLQAELRPLSERYDVVVANPPYMGSKNMNKWLGEWVKENYPDVKGDLFSCFMVRNSKMGSDHAQMGFMTPYVWMFISTYEKLRKFVIEKNTITSLIQLEYSGFAGATVPICTFTLQKGYVEGYKGGYIRLSDFVGADQQAPRALEALADPNCPWRYQSLADDFDALPGSPISYWASKSIRQSFKTMKTVGDFSKPHIGMQTGDNERFLRFWWEASFDHIFMDCDSEEESFASPKKWYPCNKGGSFRRWYGNQDYVVDWQNDGRVIVGDAEKEKRKFMNLPPEYKFKPNVAWSMLSSSCAAFRYFPAGFIFEHAASGMVGDETILMSILGFCNSEVAKAMLALVSPTLNFNVSSIAQLPMNPEKNDVVAEIARENVTLTKSDWDSFEESWNFEKHPLV